MPRYTVQGTVRVSATVEVDADSPKKAYALAHAGDFDPLSFEVQSASADWSEFQPDQVDENHLEYAVSPVED